MNRLVAAIVITLAASPLAIAQNAASEDPAKAPSVQKAPTAKQKAQQARMRECAQQSAGRTGEERNKYMSACLKAQAAAPADERKLAQQARMKSCSKEASEKKLKGAERKSYMSGCLKKS